MVAALVAGAAAGYGIAIPVGAIAVLILETGLHRGPRLALFAGAGAATADGLYASLAALFGVAVEAVVAPVAGPLRVAAAALLAVIGLRGLLRAGRQVRAAPDPEATIERPSSRRTYLGMLGLTVVNPTTVVYFAALVLGLPSTGHGAAEKAAFAGGAFLASLSWQSVLALTGGLLHGRLSPRARLVVSAAGNLIVLGFAARIALAVATG